MLTNIIEMLKNHLKEEKFNDINVKACQMTSEKLFNNDLNKCSIVRFS